MTLAVPFNFGIRILSFCLLAALLSCAPRAYGTSKYYVKDIYTPIIYYYSDWYTDSGYAGPSQGAACTAWANSSTTYAAAHGYPESYKCIGWEMTPSIEFIIQQTDLKTGYVGTYGIPDFIAYDCHGAILGGNGDYFPQFEGLTTLTWWTWPRKCIDYGIETTPSLQLNATSGTDHESKDVGSSPISATLPLGAYFSLSLTNKSDGSAVAGTYSLSKPKLNPAVTGAALFPNNSVLEFDSSTASTTKYFRAVHLGTETLTITPSDSSLSPVTVNITINKPTRLGPSYNEYDPGIIHWANQRGIPPQYLKGQIQRESSFIWDNYRYEPLGGDMALISKCANATTLHLKDCSSDLLKPPYSSFRLATSSLSQGDDLTAADITPRERYYIFVPLVDCCASLTDYDPSWNDTIPGRIRTIEASDSGVSALNIYHNRNGPRILDSRISVLLVMPPSGGRLIHNTPCRALFAQGTDAGVRH